VRDASVPANVDAAIRKALEKLPADRFTSTQEFAKALADPASRLRGRRGDLTGALSAPGDNVYPLDTGAIVVRTGGSLMRRRLARIVIKFHCSRCTPSRSTKGSSFDEA